jgi:hypothetical protein
MAANLGNPSPALPLWVPLRQQPDKEEAGDTERVELVLKRWHGQDVAYIGYSKTVEEHVRMLAGRQWDVWSDMLGRFVDVLQYMSEDEKRWRQRPVMDYLGYWFQLTLSKATENPPVISFLPATSDRLDAMLAEVMDPVWKTIFDEGAMDERLMRATAWCLVAGEAHVMTRAEFGDGPKSPVMAPAMLSLDRGDGSEPIERYAGSVPHDANGDPQAKLVDDPDNPGTYGWDVAGDVYRQSEGSLKFDVLCPLEVRAQWGSHIAWKDKNWVIHRWFLSKADVQRRFGVSVEADTYADQSDVSPGYLERMLFGSGYFGAARQDPNAQTTDTTSKLREAYVCGYTMWERPDPDHTPADEEQHQAGGRLLVITASKKVLWDSTRPHATEAAGPIRRCAFIDFPGRPLGSTPLEKMVPLQKRLNRVEAQIAEHTNLVTNPVLLVHELAGIGDDEWVARPGTVIPHAYMGPGRPAEWLAPPPLSPDVWHHKNDVREQLFIIGAMQGNSSETPTGTASGELVEQLRFNADRPLAPLTRSLAILIADVAEDALAILPTIWTQEKILSYAGDDNVVRTLTVLPEMFDGRVNVRPTLDSAAAESRERKQSRLIQLYQLGFWGPPATPAANAALADLLQFPNMSRAMRPGGVDRVTAEHNLGRLVRGEPATSIAVFEWYDLGVHMGVLEGYLKSPEYLTLDPGAQQQCVLYREMLQGAQQSQALNVVKRQTGFKTAAGVMEAQAAGAVNQAAITSGAVPDPAAAAGGGAGPTGPPREAGGTNPNGSPHSAGSPPQPAAA